MTKGWGNRQAERETDTQEKIDTDRSAYTWKEKTEQPIKKAFKDSAFKNRTHK